MMRHFRSKLNNARGAALVLALLVMLVLSGLALVAMNTVSTNNAMSGMHRLNTQVMSFSEALNEFGMMRSGSQASAYYAEMQNIDFEADEDALRRGGLVTFGTGGGDDVRIQAGRTGGNIGDGERLLDGYSYESVETELEPEFGYVVRDPLRGPRTEGYGDEFCFIQVTVGSQSRIGGTDGGRIGAGRALGRNASQAMIGPVEC